MAPRPAPVAPAPGIPLVQRLDALVAAESGTEGLRAKIATLARSLGVEEYQARRAVHWLVEQGRIRIIPAGRDGLRLITVAGARSTPPSLGLQGRFCPWCGSEVQEEWQYCMHCGKEQTAARMERAQPTPARATVSRGRRRAAGRQKAAG